MTDVDRGIRLLPHSGNPAALDPIERIELRKQIDRNPPKTPLGELPPGYTPRTLASGALVFTDPFDMPVKQCVKCLHWLPSPKNFSIKALTIGTCQCLRCGSREKKPHLTHADPIRNRYDNDQYN